MLLLHRQGSTRTSAESFGALSGSKRQRRHTGGGLQQRCCHAYAEQQSKVNVLLVGGGGREHALAWKLSQSPLCGTLYCAPTNPGILEETNVSHADVDSTDHSAVVSFCRDNGVEFVFVGPEAPLVDGLVDTLKAASVPAFGPSKAAARLEGSKVFMKDLCKKYGIPTAFYESFAEVEPALDYVRARGAPIVVKASGLAAGKGVIVADTVEVACSAVRDILDGGRFGAAGSEVVIEEFLEGEEASYFALLDGTDVVGLASAQDHKRAFDGDAGPNTGGMGAYTPAPVMTAAIERQVIDEIVQRTADAMVAEGAPFQGVLFAGLMIKDGKAKLLEHNVRFGDPEVQGLLSRLQSDLLAALLQATRGELRSVRLDWSDDVALTVVLAAEGYPGGFEKGTAIRMDAADERLARCKLFHAGTATDADGRLVAAGGRVLGVTALGADVAEAQRNAYAAVAAIDWPEGYHRTDIGWRAIAAESA